MYSFSQINNMILSESPDLRSQILTLLKQVEDDSELEILRNALLRKYLKKKMDNFEKFSWYEGGAKTLVNNLILTSKATAPEKFKFVSYLNNEDMKFEASQFSNPTFKNLYDLIPTKIKNNEVFKEIAPKLLKFSEQAASGVGKGELFLLMFGKNSKKPSSRGEGAKGDVIIDGWSIEVKDSGGMIHGGKEEGLAKASAVFDYNRQMLKDAEKMGYPTEWKDGRRTIKADPEQFRFFHPRGANKKTEGGDWFWRFLTNNIPNDYEYNPKMPGKDPKKIVVEYLMKVYPTMDKKDANRIGSHVVGALGNQTKFSGVVEKYIRPWVFNSYKKAEKFNSLIVFNKQYDFANIVDGENIPTQVSFSAPIIAKGKSTYAVPSGALKISVKG